jgi:hypothetical protein
MTVDLSSVIFIPRQTRYCRVTDVITAADVDQCFTGTSAMMRRELWLPSVCVGGRSLPAGARGRDRRMHASADRRHTRGQEGTRRLSGRGAGECAELARAPHRHQAAWARDRTGSGDRRRCARLWKAIDEVFPGTRHQRCWVHKTANVLDKVALFPAEHWDHLRTSNPIEKRVRYGLSSNSAHERLVVGDDRQAHAVQPCQRGCKNLAAIEGRKSVAESSPRSQIPKRNRGHRNASSPRRLINLVTQSPA